jgi:hypothetical protein
MKKHFIKQISRFLKRELSCSIVNLHGAENEIFQQFLNIEKLYIAASKHFQRNKRRQIPPGKPICLCETNQQIYPFLVYFCQNLKIMSLFFC